MYGHIHYLYYNSLDEGGGVYGQQKVTRNYYRCFAFAWDRFANRVSVIIYGCNANTVGYS